MDETLGRYRLLERLGQGGLAEVFKAKSFGVEGFEKTLVVKRILPQLAASEAFVDAFVARAKLALRLSHANIVQVVDLGADEVDGKGTTFFLAMEYVAGVDLGVLLDHGRGAGTPLPVGLCVHLAAEAAKGLDHAHRRKDEQMRPLGIVHGDVRPRNILLSWEGEVKLCNFGMSLLLEKFDPAFAQEDGTAVRVRLPYQSPEQVRRDDPGPASDLYSLGIILYELLTGTQPFARPSSAQIRANVLDTEPTPVRVLRPELSPRLAEVVHRAIAKAPSDRYTDAALFHEDLLACLYAAGQPFRAGDLAAYLSPLRTRPPRLLVDTGDAEVWDPPSSSRYRNPAELVGVVTTSNPPTALPDLSDLPSLPSLRPPPVPKFASLLGAGDTMIQPRPAGFPFGRSLDGKAPQAGSATARKAPSAPPPPAGGPPPAPKAPATLRPEDPAASKVPLIVPLGALRSRDLTAPTEILLPATEPATKVGQRDGAKQEEVPYEDISLEAVDIDIEEEAAPQQRAPHASGQCPPLVSPIGLPQRRDVTALVLLSMGRSLDEGRDRLAVLRTLLGRYGGTLLSDAEDRTVALFGLENADGRDTEAAVRCAQVALRSLDAALPASSAQSPTAKLDERAAPNSSASPLRGPAAGLHSGRILIDPEGTPVQDESLTDLVDTAERMARLAPGELVVSTTASRNIRSLFQLEPKTLAQAHGMLVREGTLPLQSTNRFIGRKVELRRIGEVLALATRGQAQVLVLQGVQGIGKTRILEETDRRLRKGQYKVGFYTATCPPNGSAVSLSGITAMLHVLCGIREGEPASRAREVAPRLRALGLHDEELGAILFQLGVPDRPGTSLRMLRAGFARMVASLCTDQLHVFAWDDAHALDQASAKLIDDTVRQLTNACAVFAVSSREGPPPGMTRHPQLHLIDLLDLSEADAAHLVAHRAGVKNIDPTILRFCLDRAGGHPLFLEELVRELFDSGSVQVRGDTVAPLELHRELEVPRPLRALLAARLSRLSDEERFTLQAIAVLDRPVDMAVLAVMSRVPKAHLSSITHLLERRSMIKRPSPNTVAIASPLLREVLEETLTEEARRSLHAQAATACETAFGEDAADHADELASHWLAAGDRRRATEQLARHAVRKLEKHEYDETIRSLLRLFEVDDLESCADREVLTWLAQLATATSRVRTVRRMDGIVAPVLRKVDSAGEAGHRIAARVHLANILMWAHHFEPAERILSVARTLGEDSANLLRPVVFAEAALARRRSDYRRAFTAFTELLRIGARDAGEHHQIALGLALSYAAFGDRTRAFACLDRAASIFPDSDWAHAAERAKVGLLVRLLVRDESAAVREAPSALRLAQQAGLTYEHASGLHILGEALLRVGELPRAYATFQKAAASADEIGAERLAVHSRAFLSYLEARQSPQLEGSDATLGDAIAYANAHGFARDEANVRYLLARLHEQKGNVEAARAELERCQATSQTIGYSLLMQDCGEALRMIAVRA